MKKRELTKEQKFFAESAWLLFENKERILADPSMAHVPIDMPNCLAYAGSSAFEGATIGAYLELWSGDLGYRTDELDEPFLVICIAGSPLSGMNKCQIVKQNGELSLLLLDRFPGLWHLFLRLCRKYRESTYDGTTLTLEQVVYLLRE
jgi:hypothetical protein